MKKTLSFFAVLSIVLCMVSCSGTSPKDLASKYLEVQKTIDYRDDCEFMKAHGTKSERKSIAEMSDSQYESTIRQMNQTRERYKDHWEAGSVTDFEIGEETINGNEANVKVKVIYGTTKKREYEYGINFVKEDDGNWYVK